MARPRRRPCRRRPAAARDYRAQAKEAGKPDNVLDKIVEGKLQAFYKDSCCSSSRSCKDDSKTIGQLLDEAAAKVGEKVAVRRFVRYKLGEHRG